MCFIDGFEAGSVCRIETGPASLCFLRARAFAGRVALEGLARRRGRPRYVSCARALSLSVLRSRRGAAAAGSAGVKGASPLYSPLQTSSRPESRASSVTRYPQKLDVSTNTPSFPRQRLAGNLAIPTRDRSSTGCSRSRCVPRALDEQVDRARNCVWMRGVIASTGWRVSPPSPPPSPRRMGPSSETRCGVACSKTRLVRKLLALW